jgi:predicted transglutaminase-like cysteine proteinase
MIKYLSVASVAAVTSIGGINAGLAEAGRATVTSSVSQARYSGANADRIRFSVPTLAPMAFLRFCTKYPRDCEANPLRTFPVVLTAARKAELIAVNRAVNSEILPYPDRRRVVEEEWLLSPRAGDCNDYAVSKRHKLIVRGWPPHSLLLTEVVLPSGKHHLVLVVRTQEDDFILDNVDPDVRPVSHSPYRWVRAQQEINPKLWSRVSVTHL